LREGVVQGQPVPAAERAHRPVVHPLAGGLQPGADTKADSDSICGLMGP
jgi:hypothetical protein